ncbi:hypothetical protein VTO73DRAFT_6269 [Trametes versicolor]
MITRDLFFVQGASYWLGSYVVRDLLRNPIATGIRVVPWLEIAEFLRLHDLLVSFSPEAAVAGWRQCFIVLLLEHNNDASAKKACPTSLLAHGWPIDLSIQSTLGWMPLLVAWRTGKPFHLLHVNYVTSKGKTNFAEGVTSITFYAMIAMAV